MTITKAIEWLEKLKAKHGDIRVQADCPKCHCSFDCELLVIAPETVRLRETADES